MHIVCYGAGGIGGYFGARLIAAGEQVSFVARGRHAEAIAAQGLRVKSALGDLHVRPTALHAEPGALAAAAGAADLVLFAVKLPDAEAAAAQLSPLLKPGTIVLPLQNGVDVVDMLAGPCGAARVALGAAYIATRVAEPGLIEHGGPFARLRFGALQPGQRGRLEALLEACRRAGIEAAFEDDIRRAIWEKFVFLVGLSGLTALTRQPIGVVRAHASTRALLARAMEEAAALARAEGITLPADFAERQLQFVDGLPALMKASMLHDLEAGRALELPWLAAAVVRRSARAGLAAPTNQFIAAALAPYEQGAPAA
jgi:2-dehydropantoate 2-reductase